MSDTFTDLLDPQEELDFKINLSDLLEEGEAIDSWTLEPLPEATALGLTIMSGSGRDAVLTDNATSVTFWLEVAEAFQDNAAFANGGTALPLQITVVTDASPARTRQRTFNVTVAQR